MSSTGIRIQVCSCSHREQLSSLLVLSEYRWHHTDDIMLNYTSYLWDVPENVVCRHCRLPNHETPLFPVDKERQQKHILLQKSYCVRQAFSQQHLSLLAVLTQGKACHCVRWCTHHTGWTCRGVVHFQKNCKSVSYQLQTWNPEWLSNQHQVVFVMFLWFNSESHLTAVQKECAPCFICYSP